MRKGSTRNFLLGALAVLFLLASAASGKDIPLRNWQVPAGEMSKAEHFTGRSAIFAPFEPCRLEDTRVSSGGPGPIGTAGAGGTRNYDFVPGGGDCTSTLPDQVVALSLNFTIVNALGSGFLYAYPQGGTPPPVSILNYVAGDLKSNAAIVPVDPATGAITVGTGVSGTDVIIDINGVFYNNLENADQLSIFADRAAGAAILGQNSSTTAGSHGIGGFAPGAGRVYGVQGQISNVATAGSAGVRGIATVTTNPNIVYGGDFITNSDAAGSAGVLANSDSTVGVNYGLLADNDNTTTCSAGAWGRSGANTVPCTIGSNIGILGTNISGTGFSRGIVGLSTSRAIEGQRVDVAGAIQTNGVVGYIGNSGVHSFQDVTAGGAKPFVVPFQGDATKQIVFIATEADEALTATRGRVKLERGLATIKVGGHFQQVSEPEGWTVQLTPVGEMANLAVLRIDAARGEVLIKGSRNVEVFYRIEAVRRGYADFRPVQENVHFIPASSKEKMENWPKHTRDVLIHNEIYNADGTVNMLTAERLGWKAKWDKEEAEAKARAKVEAEQEKNGNFSGKSK